MRNSYQLWLKLLTVAALALFLAVDVRAECGDYVTVGGKKAPMASHSKTSPKPCHGPNCSQRPSVPVSPLAVPSTVSDGEWATLFDRAADSPPNRRGLPTADGDSRAINRSRSIFHPPRFCA